MADSNKVAPSDKQPALGHPFEYDANFKGPVDRRSCTDIICLLIFFIAILAGACVGIFAFSQGYPALLVYPTDSSGNICGTGTMKSRPNLQFFDILQCTKAIDTLGTVSCPTTQVCVSNCPNASGTFWSWPQLVVQEAGTPNAVLRRQLLCIDSVDFGQSTWLQMSIQDLVQQGYCAPYLIPSTPILYRCMPSFIISMITSAASTNFTIPQFSVSTAFGNVTQSNFQSATSVFTALLSTQSNGARIAADLQASWPQICVFALIALFIALIWVVLLRFLTGFVVWSTLIVFILTWLTLTAFCFYRYNLLVGVVNIQLPGQLDQLASAAAFRTNFDTPTFWLVFGILFGVIFLIVFLTTIFLFGRIRLATNLFEETSVALSHMPSVLLWPIVPFVTHIVAIVWSGAVAVYLATMNKPKFGVTAAASNSSSFSPTIQLPDWLTSCDYSTPTSVIQQAVNITGMQFNVSAGIANACRFISYDSAQYSIYLQLYNLFGFLWMYNFTTGIGMLVLAGCFGSYYWAFKKPEDIPAVPLLTSLWRAFRYHIGSVAMGSFLIAIVQFVRVILNYVGMQLQQQKNAVGACIVRCIDCCLWCIEKFVRFIAEKAYIIVAVHGHSFFASAKEAFNLIARNAIRAVVLNGVTKLLIFMSELSVTAFSVTLAFFYFHGEIPAAIPSLVSTWPSTLNYFYVPVIVVGIVAFAIASVSFHVYSVGTETIFLCFLEDSERHDGSAERPYFMSRRLANILK